MERVKRKKQVGTGNILQILFLIVFMITVMLIATSCTKEVENEELKVKINGDEYTGVYTGVVDGDVPNGEGKFIYEHKEDYLEYEGTWKEGVPADKGTLNTNFLIINFDEVKRKGTYEGDTVDGIPSGKGTFEAVNDDNEKYIYEGDFREGTFNGQGKLYFPESKESYVEEGNFKNGNFAPTPYEYFKAYGTYDEEEYGISDKGKKFIEEHENLFTKKRVNTKDLVNESFSYSKYTKNQDKYGDKLIRVHDLTVVQIFEGERWSYKNTTTCILENPYNDEVYSVEMLKKAKGIYEGDTVTLTALPLDYFTYPNIEDTKIWAIACAGVSITK